MIDGKACADRILESLKTRLAGTPGLTACLAVVQVGERPDSCAYVRAKRRAAERVGIAFEHVQLPEDVSQTELERHVAQAQLGADGLIVQLPLPPHLDPGSVLAVIDPDKDVDGLHPLNLGRVLQKGAEDRGTAPCTPRGVIALLDEHGVRLKGRIVALVGCGNVGRPLVPLLLDRGATVLCCNEYTPDTGAHARQADVVIAAAGRPHLVRADWVRAGCTIVDVGINRVDDPERGRPRLVGDVHPDAKAKAARYTPVPGGVGPMTVAMLMLATVEAACRHRSA